MAEGMKFLFRWPHAVEKAVIFGVCWGAILAVFLIAAVVAGGQTFGQRCAELSERRSVEWQQCVDRLAKGGRVNG